MKLSNVRNSKTKQLLVCVVCKEMLVVLRCHLVLVPLFYALRKNNLFVCMKTTYWAE